MIETNTNPVARDRQASIADNVSDAVRAWERFRVVAETEGWAVELTPAGRTKCTKFGSVVFGPGRGSDYRHMIKRLDIVDGLMARYRRRGGWS